MKTTLVIVSFALIFAALASPAYARSSGDNPGTQNAVRLYLFDPDFFTHYYGAPMFYDPFGYYSYQPYVGSPSVWIPTPPTTLFTNVISNWVDPHTLRITWTGETTRTKRMTVALLDQSRRLLLVNPSGISLTPYVVTVKVPVTAMYIDVATFDALGRETMDVTVPIPPR